MWSAAGPVASRAAEVGEKLALVRRALDAAGARAVLFRSVANATWLTAGARTYVSAGDEAAVVSALVTADGAWLLTTNVERSRLLDEEVGGLPFELVDVAWHDDDVVSAAEALCGAGRRVADLPAQGWEPAPSRLGRLRRTLVAGELERYRALCRGAARCVEEVCRAVRSGMSELEVAGRLADAATAVDIAPLVALVAADERIARYRHPLPTDNRVGTTVMVVLCGRRHGLHASCTRLATAGDPDRDLVRRHRAVARVDAAMLLASVPGATLRSVVDAAVRQYAAEGFPDEWRLHHQGGLTGYATREVFATPGSDDVLRAGQVVAWNPSITRVKSEDTAVVTPGGVDVMTRDGSWPSEDVTVAAGTLARPGLGRFG